MAKAFPWFVGDYKIQRNHVLGDGMQAEVVPGEHILTGKSVVAKITTLNTKQSCKLYKSEVSILEKLKNCDGIVQMECYFSLENYGITILERMPHDLMTLIEEDRLTLPQRLEIFKLVAFAIKQCHEKDIAHLDLKPENILVSADYSSIRLCDFGNAQVVPKHGLVRSSSGTLLYAAPENLHAEFFDGKKSDIWSLGILYHVLISYHWPYVINGDKDLKKKISRGQISIDSNVSEPQVQILMQMLQIHPQDRIDINALCTVLQPPRQNTKLIKRSSFKRLTKLLKL